MFESFNPISSAKWNAKLRRGGQSFGLSFWGA
jgi:hypothetical protein